MFDRTDLDMRINAHWNQTDTINQSYWQTATANRPAGTLRRGIATALVALAAKLDGATLPQSVKQEPVSGYAG